MGRCRQDNVSSGGLFELRPVPARPAWLQVAAVFGGFLVGPLIGLLLGVTVVPDSGLVQTAGILGFALVFVGGTLVWSGLGFTALVFAKLRAMVTARVPRRDASPEAQRVAPPGYRAYVVLGGLVGISVGILAGFTTELALGPAVTIWTVSGLGYGAVLWSAAHWGYLPFID